MENSKIADIVEKLRLREEQQETKKKTRRVSFADMCASKDEVQEDICIFKATKIRERLEEWPDEQKQKPDVFKTILDGIRNHTMNDLMITFKNITFKCPTILLTCFSDIFKNIDRGVCLDLSLYGIRPKCFKNIYKWMLTEAIQGRPGLCEINQSCVLEMLNASKQLKIPHLEDQCWYFLQKTAQCDENIAFELYKASDYNLKEIQQLMLSRVCKYFLTLVSSEDYLKLDVDEVCTLLSSDTLGVNSEIEVFYAAVLWLSYLWNERKDDSLLKVIKCVRFKLMPSWYLITLTERTGTEEIDNIIALSHVTNLITDAIIFSATQLSFLSGSYKASDKTMQDMNKNMPSQRRWLYDKSCAYHYRPNAASMEYVTFEMFTYYLKRLREFGKDYWRTLDFSTPDHCTRIWKSRPNSKF